MSMAPEDSVMTSAEKDNENKLPFLPGQASLGSAISARKDSYVDFVDSIQQSMYMNTHG